MKYFYSDYPLEQAAFEQVVEASERIQRMLEGKPSNTLTTQIAGHVYWIADGELLASPSAPTDGSAPSELDINDGFTVQDIDGIGVSELSDIVRDSLRWLEKPEFVMIPEGSPLNTEDRRYWAKEHPNSGPVETDPRIGLSKGNIQVMEPVPEPSMTIAVRYNDSSWWPTVVAIDGVELQEPRLYSKELTAFLAQLGYRISGITMTVPYIDVLGTPSAFKPGQLELPDLAVYLLKNIGLTPFFKTGYGDVTASTHLTQGEKYSVTVAITIPREAEAWIRDLPLG
jgi:hypothetical protein